MRRADRIAGPAGEIGLVGWREQNLLRSPRWPVDFGFGAPPGVQFERAVAGLAEAPDRRWIFAHQVFVAPCLDAAKVTVVGRANRLQWSMFQAGAVKPGCTLPRAAATTPADDGD
jgi:hypothetical protein